MQIGEISEYYDVHPPRFSGLYDHIDTLNKVKWVLIAIIVIIVVTSYQELGREIASVLTDTGLFTN